MKIQEITRFLEQVAPRNFQESYDNSGLLVGDPGTSVTGILITLDVTESVIEEAVRHQANLIVAHHPLIFKGLKQLTGRHWVERCVIKAIKNDIAIYAIHTNLDNIALGVNRKIAEKLGLVKPQILLPKNDTLCKLVTFVPAVNKQEVLNAMYAAGAGQIGHYDHCSFQLHGTGTFRPDEQAQPHIGTNQQDETVEEIRLEVLVPTHKTSDVREALREAHPYEEVAYYLTALNNEHQEVGSGMVGELPEAIPSQDFLQSLKNKMKTQCIRHTDICKKTIKKVAICGGSGSFLLSQAKRAGADVFVTADFKYHDFFEADKDIIVADIGHYESEQFTKELLYEFLSKKFTNIALRLTEEVTNPIIYL